MKEGNLNAAPLGNIFPWGKIKEEGLRRVCKPGCGSVPKTKSIFTSKQGRGDG